MRVENETLFDTLKLGSGFNPFLPGKIAQSVFDRIAKASQAKSGEVANAREHIYDTLAELHATRTLFIEAAQAAGMSYTEAATPFDELSDSTREFTNSRPMSDGDMRLWKAINAVDRIADYIWDKEQSSSAVQQEVPGRSVVVSDLEMRILKTLLKSQPQLLTNVEIKVTVRRSKQAVDKAVSSLIGKGLVDRPNGKRKGLAITRKGFDLLKKTSSHP